MIVVDTNVLAYLLLDLDRTQQAEKALARDPEWVAPRLWRSEMRSVLAVQVKRGALDVSQARRLQSEAERLMDRGEYAVASADVLDLAAGSGCSSYDCEFVALARELEVPLVTVDRELLEAFPDRAVPLDTFAEAAP